jgi:TPP-dependent trihydroxycyclohexane-1,2-dione (THcHDO) dehydratase
MTLTVAQALVRFLASQYTERDGERQRLIAGCFGIFGSEPETTQAARPAYERSKRSQQAYLGPREKVNAL